MDIARQIDGAATTNARSARCLSFLSKLRPIAQLLVSVDRRRLSLQETHWFTQAWRNNVAVDSVHQAAQFILSIGSQCS